MEIVKNKITFNVTLDQDSLILEPSNVYFITDNVNGAISYEKEISEYIRYLFNKNLKTVQFIVYTPDTLYNNSNEEYFITFSCDKSEQERLQSIQMNHCFPLTIDKCRCSCNISKIEVDKDRLNVTIKVNRLPFNDLDIVGNIVIRDKCGLF